MMKWIRLLNILNLLASVIKQSVIRIKYLAALAKIRIPVAVTLSALTGFILKDESISLNLILPVMGVFFLSSASAALNSLQEVNYDSRMARTLNRPIPSGKISKARASAIIGVSFLIGFFLLLKSGGLIPASIGVITFAWYNFLYTPLKRITSYALFIGAFVGAFPPLIGWSSAGGNVTDIKIVSLSLMIFIWQIPHFMLLLLYHGDEYKEAGFKVLSNYLSPNQLRNLIRIWILATTISVVPLWFSGVVMSGLFFFLILVISAALLFSFLSILKKPVLNYRRAFFLINIYLIMILFLVILDGLT